MSDQQATRESKLAEALRHCVEIFKSMAARGAYPQELLPWDSDGRESPIFMGKQGFQFALDALATHDAREGERAEPSDGELRRYAVEEEFLLFCSEDEFLDIAKSVLRRFGASQPRPEQAAQGQSVDGLMAAINDAATRLPRGAEVSIHIERDAGTVCASDWDGNWREFDAADMSIAEQVKDCTEWCIAQDIAAAPQRESAP